MFLADNFKNQNHASKNLYYYERKKTIPWRFTREEYCTRGYKYKFSHMPLILKKRKPPTTTTITSICHKKIISICSQKSTTRFGFNNNICSCPKLQFPCGIYTVSTPFFFKKKVSLDTVRQSSIKIHSVNKSPSFNVHTKKFCSDSLFLNSWLLKGPSFLLLW